MKIWLNEIMEQYGVSRLAAQGLMNFLMEAGAVESLGSERHPQDPPKKRGRMPKTFDLTSGAISQAVDLMQGLSEIEAPTKASPPVEEAAEPEVDEAEQEEDQAVEAGAEAVSEFLEQVEPPKPTGLPEGWARSDDGSLFCEACGATECVCDSGGAQVAEMDA